jgi:hypothetical protein
MAQVGRVTLVFVDAYLHPTISVASGMQEAELVPCNVN